VDQRLNIHPQMANWNETSIISLVRPLRSFVDSFVGPETIHLGLEYAAAAPEHPVRIVTGVVGALGAIALYKAIKKATALRGIDGPASPSFLWGKPGVSFEVIRDLTTQTPGHMPMIFGSATSIPFQEGLLNTYGAVCKMKGMMGVSWLI
jgi:hypothetical protein